MLRLIVIFVLSAIVMVSNAHALENQGSRLKKYQDIAWDDYRIDTLRKEVPTKLHGNSISLVPLEKMHFLPRANMYELKETWAKAGILWPDVIVLARGRYDLPALYKNIDNDKIIEKTTNNTYLIKRPVYIASTASLLINKSTARLSLKHGVYIIYHGGLDILDSTVTSWDSKKNNYGPRAFVEDNRLLLFLEQQPRPYIIGLEGSFTKMINSDITGLGYKGQAGTYGISLLKPTASIELGSIKSLLRKRNQPQGIFIGNNISQCFFGFYTNNAKNVVLAGNILHDNVIYNFDPHDYSSNLIIAKNVSYKAGHAHGIIISREVHDSVIADNIAFLNAGSGVMLDRSCEDNLIYNNLSVLNMGDGITIYESDKNYLAENTLIQNRNNGLFVRNSTMIQVAKNSFLHNGNNGAELSVVNIDDLETRDFVLDPYNKKSHAWFEDNLFERNVNAALSVKNGARFFFKNNTLQDSGPLYFSGDIEDIAQDILQKNKLKGFLYEPNEVQK